MPSICPRTKVSPSQATPKTHIAAVIPERNVLVSTNFDTSSLHAIVIIVAIASIKLIIAWSLFIITGSIHFKASLIALA